MSCNRARQPSSVWRRKRSTNSILSQQLSNIPFVSNERPKIGVESHTRRGSFAYSTISSDSALVGTNPRYAIWPEYTGSTISRNRAASSVSPRFSASSASSLYIVRRTAERMPSLPTTRSQVAVVPSLKLSVIGSVADVSEYDFRRFEKWILSPASRCFARSCCRSDLWNVCTDLGVVRHAAAPGISG